MSCTIVVDLSSETIEKYEEEYQDYGRGLAVRLLLEHTPERCSRLGTENALVIVPGLFTGAPVACANRASIVARDEEPAGVLVGSITGDMPQKMASLHIASLVIKGRSKEGEKVLYIDEDRVELCRMPELQGKGCGAIVDIIREKWGRDSAVIGCGPAADLCLPISSMFATYPEGEPRFSCPRSSFGDVPASKGMRAIVIRHARYFDAPCYDRVSLQQEGKKLARYIVEDPICGGALPGLGSITLLHLLKNRDSIPEAMPKDTERQQARIAGGNKKVNYSCAPMCVIGCLNRHHSGSGQIYHAPDESEVRAAVEQCFRHTFSDKEMDQCASMLTSKGMELGIHIKEFVYTLSLYMEAIHEIPSIDRVRELAEEMRKGTVVGRVLGGGTAEVSRLFRDHREIGRKVTRPAVWQEQQYHLKMDRTVDSFGEEISNLELLYREIFLCENLGICIFTSFAVLNKPDTLQILANLYEYKTGRIATVGELLQYSAQCLHIEDKLRKNERDSAAMRNIPEFVKVLYRYFGDAV